MKVDNARFLSSLRNSTKSYGIDLKIEKRVYVRIGKGQGIAQYYT